jgi:hypothetical protein
MMAKALFVLQTWTGRASLTVTGTHAHGNQGQNGHGGVGIDMAAVEHLPAVLEAA